MVAPVKEKVRVDDAAYEEEGRPDLSEEQREMLRSLERSFQQAARGETRSVWEFLEELQLEQEAAAHASRDNR